MADTMNGRIVMVTGATSGIGEVTARELARKGATTILVARNEAKAQRTVAQIKENTDNPNVEYMIADLSVMDEVRKLAADFQAKYDQLHILVNNAGMMFTDYQKTADGYERTFALNHLNYFLLTNLLLDTIKASGEPDHYARIVNVSSDAHQFPRDLNFDELHQPKNYGAMRAYGESKLENIMFTYELARRLAKEGAYVTANVLHPGAVATGFGRNNSGFMGTLSKIAVTLLAPLMKSADAGAETSIYLASSPEVEGISGAYFDNCKMKESSPLSKREDYWQRLWAVSEELTGLRAYA